MTNLHKEKTKPDKKLTAVCGNFCPSCTFEYVRKHKEHILDHLERTCPE